MMTKILTYTKQAIAYLAFIVFIGYFSSAPTYIHLPSDQAVLKLTITHPGKPVGECYQRSDAALAKLPPNMRIRQVCPRERSYVAVELEMDNKILYREILPPNGLSRDGLSTTYQRFAVAAGQHHLRAKLKDDLHKPTAAISEDDYTYINEQQINLKPAQVFIIDFSNETEKFVFK